MIVSDITELLPDSWGQPSRKPITSCVLLKEVMKVIVIYCVHAHTGGGLDIYADANTIFLSTKSHSPVVHV